MPVPVDRLVTSWDERIPQSMRRLDVPGLAVGFCDADSVIWSASYGSTRRHGGEAITPTTRFSVQSTSKLVTAALVVLAVQQGLVDLDTPVSHYLPEFSVHSLFDERPQDLITLRHLLDHTAGFTHDAPVGSNYDVGTGTWADHCQSITRTWLRFPVGHHFEYSNLGIDLAGHILERVWGAPFAELAERELLGPLAMTRSTFDPDVLARDSARAVGHWRPFDRAGRELPVEVPMVPSGGLYATVEDLLRFVRLHLRHGAPLLPASALATQYEIPVTDPGQRLGYGLGVFVDEWPPGVRVLHHGGSGLGFQCQVCWLPDAGAGLVVLTNSFDHDLPTELARAFAENVAHGAALPSSPAPSPTPAIPTDPAALVEPAGEYVGRLDRITLRDGNDGWVAVRGAHVHHVRQVRAVGSRTVELDDGHRTRLRASTGRDGSIAYLLDLRDGQAYYRNDVAAMPPSTLPSAYLGTYRASLCGVEVARFRIAQDGATPVVQQDHHAALGLVPIDATHYISSTGEVLDLNAPGVSYRNIALCRVDGAPAPERF